MPVDRDVYPPAVNRSDALGIAVEKVQHTSPVGRAITAAFLEHSTVASEITWVVLDSPNPDLRGTVEYGAQQLKRALVGSAPTSLPRVAEQIAAARYDLDWDGVYHLDDTSWVTVPPLVFQATDDETAPMVAAGQRRDSRPQLVTLEKVNGAGHVEAWNIDPQASQRQLTGAPSSS